jgi:hypothetical protein
MESTKNSIKKLIDLLQNPAISQQEDKEIRAELQILITLLSQRVEPCGYGSYFDIDRGFTS